jgi:hypothetical protein
MMQSRKTRVLTVVNPTSPFQILQLSYRIEKLTSFIRIDWIHVSGVKRKNGKRRIQEEEEERKRRQATIRV